MRPKNYIQWQTKQHGLAVLNKTMTGVDFLKGIASFTPRLQNHPPAPELYNAKHPRICHLMGLPPELRIIIYEFALRTTRKRLYKRLQFMLFRGPGLLLVSKKVRREVMPVYFKCNTFNIQAGLASYRHTGIWLGKLAELYGPEITRGFQLHVLDHAWSKYPQAWRLVKMVGEGTIKLDLKAIESDNMPDHHGFAKLNSLFLISRYERGYYIQVALEEAVLWGPKGNRKGWSTEKSSRKSRV